MTMDWLPRTLKRRVLRRLGRADLADFQAYRSDLEVTRYQGRAALPDEEASSFLAAVYEAELLRPGHWSRISIADPATGRLIGAIGIRATADQEEAEIGSSLARQGLARMACRSRWGLSSLN